MYFGALAVFAAFLALIMVRTVRRDIAQYNRDENDLEDTLEETGWKLVHGDAFRPPPHSKLLTSLIGAGIQLFGMGIIVICKCVCDVHIHARTFTVLSMLGMLSPASRGSLPTTALFLYCFMGLFAGYYAGRLYKTMRGVQWKRAAFQVTAVLHTCVRYGRVGLQVAVTFPGTVLGTGLIINFFMMGEHSSGAIPFTAMLSLLFMWIGIDLPLVFIGFYFGFRKQVGGASRVIEFSCLLVTALPTSGPHESDSASSAATAVAPAMASLVRLAPRLQHMGMPSLQYRHGRPPAIWCNVHRIVVHFFCKSTPSRHIKHCLLCRHSGRINSTIYSVSSFSSSAFSSCRVHKLRSLPRISNCAAR